MKRIATITKNGNVLMTVHECPDEHFCSDAWDDLTLGAIGPLTNIEILGYQFLLATSNGCSFYADEIRREE